MPPNREALQNGNVLSEREHTPEQIRQALLGEDDVELIGEQVERGGRSQFASIHSFYISPTTPIYDAEALSRFMTKTTGAIGGEPTSYTKVYTSDAFGESVLNPGVINYDRKKGTLRPRVHRSHIRVYPDPMVARQIFEYERARSSGAIREDRDMESMAVRIPIPDHIDSSEEDFEEFVSDALRVLAKRATTPGLRSAYESTAGLLEMTREPRREPPPFSESQLARLHDFVLGKMKDIRVPELKDTVGKAVAGIRSELRDMQQQKGLQLRMPRRNVGYAVGGIAAAGALIFVGQQVRESTRPKEIVPAGYDGVLANTTLLWRSEGNHPTDSVPDTIKAITSFQKLLDLRMKLSDDARVVIEDYSDHLAGWVDPKIGWAEAYEIPGTSVMEGVQPIKKIVPPFLQWHDNKARHFAARIRIEINRSSNNKNQADWDAHGIWLLYIPKQDEVQIPHDTTWDKPVFFLEARYEAVDKWIYTSVDSKTSGITGPSAETVGTYKVPPKKILWVKNLPK